ncbi:MAG: response regulator transcription factor [Candidatus Obscuribacter sp.]|nr:response regulator transcription factor [Candidatus Obscuribacter sp.]
MFRFLLVDDDLDLCDSIVRECSSSEFSFDCAYDAVAAWLQLQRCKYDLLVIDWGLPGTSGVDLCKQFRETGATTPIIMLTGRDQIEHKERGYGAGVDDYLTKPFHMKELLLRIAALLKRTNTEDVLRARDLEFHTCSRRLFRNGAEILLSPTEYSLLEYLMRNSGSRFKSDALLSRIWPSDSDATEQTLRTYIMRLRKILDTEGQPTYIDNRYGLGYQFNEGGL